MKSLPLILALAALSLVPVLPSCTYTQVLERQEDGMAMLSESLVQVSDKASADAAADAVRRYGHLLRSDISTLLGAGRPSLLQLAQLRYRYKDSSLNADAKSVLREYFRIFSRQYYGSTALRQAFSDMMKPSRG